MTRNVRVRSALQICALIALGLLSAAQKGSATGSTATYQFVGTCSDCTGTGVGTLVLQNYTLGTSLSNSNFVSFTYSSNLISNLSVTQGQLGTLSGQLPASLPTSFANVSISVSGGGIVFGSGEGWCAGISCADDSGPSYTWSLLTTSSVPAMSPPVSIALALMLAIIGAYFRKQVTGRVQA